MTIVRGGRIPAKEHRKLKVEDTLDLIFERLIFARIASVKRVNKDCLFMPEDMGPMWAHIPGEDDSMIFFPEDAVNSPEIVWPVSVGMLFHARDCPEWGDSLKCNYWTSKDAKSLRGGFVGIGRKNIAWYTGVLDANKIWTPAVNVGAWHLGKWRPARRMGYDQAFIRGVRHSGTAPIDRRPLTGEDDFGAHAAMGQSVALSYRYEWGAQFSIGRSARIIIPTTPKGVLELFNDRNKPADKDRRAALRHWVSQHRRRKQGGDFGDVRRHLRGETAFQWRGFDVTIRPSAFDDERNRAE